MGIFIDTRRHGNFIMLSDLYEPKGQGHSRDNIQQVCPPQQRDTPHCPTKASGGFIYTINTMNIIKRGQYGYYCDGQH